MELDPALLARIQFGLTVTFHIIFPTMSIGLSLFLVITEGLFLWTKDELYSRIYKFWLTIFAMGFGVGVATGIVLSFELGTNFAKFSQLAGPVVGPVIALEVVTAFFVEAGFLGIMLFGKGRVGPRVHFFATCMVALGTNISASWIMSVNSWMQTPAGFAMEGGRFVVTDWWEVILNPSYLARLPHMLLAAYISGSFFVAGVAAYYLLKQRHLDFARRTFSIGLGLASLFIAVQFTVGDKVAMTMAGVQPSKFQAMEGNWDSKPTAPYLLFIVPDQANQKNSVEVGIPYLGSIINTHSLNGTVPGLKLTPPADQPPMGPVFYSFRLMFFLGTAMFAAACIGIWLRWSRRLFTTRWFHMMMVILTPAGFIATVSGWYTAEIGRQPWVIFGHLRTADALSPVSGGAVLTTLLLAAVIYTAVFVAFLVLTGRAIARGPDGVPETSSYSGSQPRIFMDSKSIAPVSVSESSQGGML